MSLAESVAGEPTANAVKPRLVHPALLAAVAVTIVAGAVVVAVSLTHRHSTDSEAATSTYNAFQPSDTLAPVDTLAPIDTVPPTTAAWIPPSGFFQLPGKPNFAYKILPLNETHCTGFYPCWNLTVIAHRGCDYGVGVTVNVEHPDGTVVDSATDESYGPTTPGQATLLKPENTSGQTDVVGELNDIHCLFT